MNPATTTLLYRAADWARERGIKGDPALAGWLEHEAYMVEVRGHSLDGTTGHALNTARAILGERAEVTT